LKTQDFIVPEGTTQIFFFIYLRGVGVVKIRKPSLVNVSY